MAVVDCELMIQVVRVGATILLTDWTVNVRVADWVCDMAVTAGRRRHAEAVEARPEDSVDPYWGRPVGAIEALCR